MVMASWMALFMVYSRRALLWVVRLSESLIYHRHRHLGLISFICLETDVEILPAKIETYHTESTYHIGN